MVLEYKEVDSKHINKCYFFGLLMTILLGSFQFGWLVS